MSIQLGFKGWSDFLLALGTESKQRGAIRDCISKGAYEQAADLLATGMSPAGLANRIELEYCDDRIVGSRLRGTAVELLPRIADGLALTTNYDRVLETVYDRSGEKFTNIVCGAHIDESARAISQNHRALIKLHGDVYERSHRILTSKEYDDHYGDLDGSATNQKPLVQVLDGLLRGRAILFVGCSLQNDRLTRLLRRIAMTSAGARLFAILERQSTDGRQRDRALAITQMGIRPIWYPSGRHDLIRGILQYLAGVRAERQRRIADAKGTV